MKFPAPLSLALFVAVSVVLTSPASAEDAPSAERPVDTETDALIRRQGRLIIARSGGEVSARWELPDIEVRGVELLRNTQAGPKGRKRVASVSKKSTHYVDTLPDASAAYWYWLKVTLKDGRSVGLGPVATPSAEVWTPSE